IRLVEAYCKEQGLYRSDGMPEPLFSETLSLDLSTVEPSLAGPRRPQDRVALSDVKTSFLRELPSMIGGEPASPNHERLATWKNEGGSAEEPEVAPASPLDKRVPVTMAGESFELRHGSVVIAAITSCTNTSNPEVLVAAGLLAKKAVERGVRSKAWVKASLAPGSKVVVDYLEEAGLMPYLEQLGFYLVGYGCTTCIGNSGPLPAPIADAVDESGLVAAAVLSGNRNFEGRVHGQVRANYLASPPLVVAYALAGRMDVDLQSEPLGEDAGGKPVYLRDLWPSQAEIHAVVSTIRADMFREGYSTIFDGTDEWRALDVPAGEHFAWEPDSTYVRLPPFFEGLSLDFEPPRDIAGARALVVLGDSVTTDHISPAGAIAKGSPAAQYLIERGVEPKDFNTYGARRGNHEVLMRGTFANVRLRNELAPGTEGWWTQLLPSGEQQSIYDAALRYRQDGVPLIAIAGKEYGTGSSRDWAAKGPALLGVRAAIAESFERIYRSNLIGMGVLPLQFEEGQSRASLGLTGREAFDITGISEIGVGSKVAVRAVADDGKETSFTTVARIDTPVEVEYYRHGGILPFVLRQLARD
ncbi:MAG: aconitate hydratase AcnA, partial [Dehalococcoidia bacterium]